MALDYFRLFSDLKLSQNIFKSLNRNVETIFDILSSLKIDIVNYCLINDVVYDIFEEEKKFVQLHKQV